MAGGSGGSFGSGIFLQNLQTISLSPPGGKTLTILDDVTDASSHSSGGGGGSLLFSGAGSVVLDGTTELNGTATLEAGTLQIGDAKHTKASVFLDGGVQFNGTATLDLGDPVSGKALNNPLSAGVGGFAQGDKIDLAGIGTAAVNFDGSHINYTLPSSNPASFGLSTTGPGTVQIVSDGNGGSLVELACFVTGTRIATERGMMPVEALREGDRVRTLLDGKPRPIIWIGHRRVDCRRHPDPSQVWPICITADAFGPGRPFFDLWLSPDHAVFIDGALIPIRYLVNGRTIFQQAQDTVTYWHVELSEHTVLSAEGVPVESYLDTGNRSAFANGGPVMDLHPDFAWRVWATQACARIVLNGPRLAAAKRRLIMQASALGSRTTDDAKLSVLVDGQPVTAETDGRVWYVRVPASANNIHLASRTWSPMHVEPDSDDTRRLRVAITRIRLDGHAIALDSPALASGWHAIEPDWRWTDGNGLIAACGARELVFEVALTGTYWHDGSTWRARVA